jgi:ribosome biogenesis protein SSF1/2
MPKKRKANKKQRARQKQQVEEDESSTKEGRTMVLKRGKVSDGVRDLVDNVRKVLMPTTASRLRERRSNTIKDFVSIAGPLGVSHLLIFSQAEESGSCQLRIVRSPRGPTLTFRVHSYSLMADVVSVQRRPVAPTSEYKFSPLIVLNGFVPPESGERDAMVELPAHEKLLSVALRSLVPPLNVHTVALSHAKRVLLFDYDRERDRVECRHYMVTMVPVAASKEIADLVDRRRPKSLRHLRDISELVTDDASMSTAADDGSSPSASSPASTASSARQGKAIKLVEIGPRIEMQLLKIEEEVCEGETLYHALVEKSSTEIKALRAMQHRKRQEKDKRRAEQEANVRRKQEQDEQDERAERAERKKRRREDGHDDSKKKKKGKRGDNSDSDSDSDSDVKRTTRKSRRRAREVQARKKYQQKRPRHH